MQIKLLKIILIGMIQMHLLLASIYLKLDNVEECAKYMLIAYDPDKKEDYNGVTRLIKIYIKMDIMMMHYFI